MPKFSRLKFLYFALFSHPRCDRRLYRLLWRRRPASFVELGIGDLARSRRLIDIAQRSSRPGRVSYCAVDPFDARGPSLPSLRLIDAHRELSKTGCSVRLIPGEPADVLARHANDLMASSVVLIADHVDEEAMSRAWFWLPRMLTSDSLVMAQRHQDEQVSWTEITLAEIDERAALSQRRIAA